jgi:hypothetical protein
VKNAFREKESGREQKRSGWKRGIDVKHTEDYNTLRKA